MQGHIGRSEEQVLSTLFRAGQRWQEGCLPGKVGEKASLSQPAECCLLLTKGTNCARTEHHSALPLIEA